MKFNKWILTTAAVFGLAAAVQAQDVFASTRTVVLSAPATLATIGTTYTTNGPIDVRQFGSKVAIDIFSVTNAAAATITATFQTSDDKTNWYALPNYAKATATSVSTTNYWNSYSNVVSQTVLIPGVWTTPTAASAGWATPYLAPATYTNSGACDVSLNGYTKLAYPVRDGRQYLRVIWTQSGGAGATNATVGVTVTGPGTFSSF